MTIVGFWLSTATLSDHSFLGSFSHGLCGQKCNTTWLCCVPIVEEKMGWIMLVVVLLAHNNILLGTATQW